MQIADIARQRGLGEVTTITDRSQIDPNIGFDFNSFQQAQQRAAGGSAGGPVMVVDEKRGSIIYYGTQTQQSQLETLIKELDIQSEQIVTRVFKLRHSDAEDVAEIVNGLISNTTPAGSSEFLPESGGFSSFRGSRSRSGANTPRNFGQPDTPAAPGEEGLSLDAENSFVIADVKNNQILIKAPAGQQPEFAKLLERLDLRRPQVYVEAQIVAVSADDRLRLAFETQLINAGGAGGVLNTNFGLGSFGDAAFNQPKSVSTGLGGLTAAIIKSDQIPIIMRALANETDSRIVSSPQLLVDDNEEAEVVSLDQQPTSTVNRGNNSGNNDIVSAGDYAEAGTTLRVTPRISDGGYLRLKYEVELSSFTGEGQTLNNTTLPPPRQQNTIKSESVTIPSDSTVVIGGLVVDSTTKTIAKVPLLGDIPLIGLLFQDRSTGDRSTTLYIFLTPKILREPNFTDLKLLTRGPRASSRIDPDAPEMKPSIMDSGSMPMPGVPARKAPAEPTPMDIAPSPASASISTRRPE
jgi:general secretion pathway protein D